MSSRATPGQVQTVLGPVAPSDLGFTLPHEHTKCSLWWIENRWDYWELIGDEPAKQIGGAAGGIGHDHLDGAVGIGLRTSRSSAEQQQPAAPCDHVTTRERHGPSPTMLFVVRLRTTIADYTT